YDDAVAAFIVETERWDLATKLFGQLSVVESGDHAGHGSQGAAPSKPAAQTSQNTRRGVSLPPFVRALAAASAGSADAEKLLSEMRANRQQNNDAYGAKILDLRELEVAALISASKKTF